MQRMSIITYFIMRLLGFENYGPWFRTFATGRGNSKFFVQPAPVLITSECGRQGSSGREGAGGKDRQPAMKQQISIEIILFIIMLYLKV